MFNTKICPLKNIFFKYSKLKNANNIRFFSLSHKKDFHVCLSSPMNKWKHFYQENRGICKLFERISRKNHLAILNHAFHMTASHSNSQRDASGDGPNKNNDDKTRWSQLASRIGIALFLSSGIMYYINNSQSFDSTDEVVSWNEFVHQMLAKGEVKEVIVKPNQNVIHIILHEGAVIRGKRSVKPVYTMNFSNLAMFENKLRNVEETLGIKPGMGVPIHYVRTPNIPLSFLLAALIFLALPFLFRKSSIDIIFKQPFTKAKYTMIDPLLPGSGRGVKFSDVAGAHEAKQEVMEFVDFLKDPAKYQKLGAKIPKGALLLGPPGCGKTLLAKAVATEGNVPFLAMNGSEFIELVGGLGAARVRDLFKQAKKRSPAIIYIDEIDAIGKTRSSSLAESTGEGEQTLNQLLVEMDGLLTKEGIILLASTNRSDILDKALLRPGRFDRHIIMDYPTLEERREIFEHHLKNIILEKPASFYSRRMASLTLGFSGADIANVVNEAALYAARNAKTLVSGGDLEYAVERVVGGTEKRSQVLSLEEKRVVAYHESGHALIGWLLEHTDALLKVTIIPRTNLALGFAQYSPKDQKLYTQQEIFEKMCMALGGRVAESLTFNRVTTGAENDLSKVTRMAYAQVRTFGFSDKVGQVSFPEEESRESGKRPYSQKLASIIDEEASKLIFEAYKKTEEVLKNNMDKLKLLAESLLQKESLTYEEVEVILGPPPHGQKIVIEPLEFENEIQNWKGEHSEKK